MNRKDLITSFSAAALIAVLSYPTILNVAENLTTSRQIAISLALGILTVIGLFVLYFAKRWLEVLWQVGKFIVTGGLNTFVDFGVLNLLIIFTGVAAGTQFSIFKGIAFTVAVINSYYWNKYWTFEFKEKKKGEFLEFIGISVIGLIINVGIASIVVNVLGPQGGISEVVWANIGAFAATLTALAWNFVGYKFIVFKKKGSTLLTS